MVETGRENTWARDESLRERWQVRSEDVHLDRLAGRQQTRERLLRRARDDVGRALRPQIRREFPPDDVGQYGGEVLESGPAQARVLSQDPLEGGVDAVGRRDE